MKIKVFFAVFMLLCLTQRSSFCEIEDDYIREGMDRMKSGKYRDAAVYFEAAYSANPDNPNIASNLTSVYHNIALEEASKDNWHAAIGYEERSLKHSPNNSAIKEQLGILYNNQGLEYAKNKRFEEAVDCLKKSLAYSAQPDLIKQNLYNLMISWADYCMSIKNDYRALKALDEARALQADNPQAYMFAGNIYYQQDNYSKAIENWAQALKLKPGDTGLQNMIDKAKREAQTETGFKSGKKEHFLIKFDKESDSEYIYNIHEMLEEARLNVRNMFNLSANDVIPVIVYSSDQFKQATEAGDWTLGVYDGKIRLRGQDITRKSELLRRVIYHEYAHAALFLTYGTNIPLWLNEGFAQFCEPDVPIADADKIFIRRFLKDNPFTLAKVDAMFMQKTDPVILRAAYLESRLFVSYLIEKYRKDNLKRLFEKLKDGVGWQEALRIAYNRDVKWLEEDFCQDIEYLLR